MQIKDWFKEVNCCCSYQNDHENPFRKWFNAQSIFNHHWILCSKGLVFFHILKQVYLRKKRSRITTQTKPPMRNRMTSRLTALCFLLLTFVVFVKQFFSSQSWKSKTYYAILERRRHTFFSVILKGSELYDFKSWNLTKFSQPVELWLIHFFFWFEFIYFSYTMHII
jgi:hypothetical protein